MKTVPGHPRNFSGFPGTLKTSLHHRRAVLATCFAGLWTFFIPAALTLSPARSSAESQGPLLLLTSGFVISYLLQRAARERPALLLLTVSHWSRVPPIDPERGCVPR